MDNFMDRLAQKFSAQEMIKANSQAEAAEIKRLQFQVSEYEKILQEMRRLNYKNTEISEKLDEMIGDGAKKLFGMREEQEKLVASMRDLAVEQTKIREAELSQREQALMEREREVQQIRVKQEEARLEKEHELEQARMEKERALEQARFEHERAEREREERERVMEEIRQERERAEQAAEEARSENEDEEQKESDFNVISGIIEEKFKYSDDFVHKESVKVYRNVQAVVVDELKRYAENVTAENNKLRTKISNVMTVSVISMVASAAGLAISVLILTALGVF